MIRSDRKGYPAFKVEAQILTALEEKGWTYEQLAAKVGRKKSNISRDLQAGGIANASFSRIQKIAKALGMKFVAVLVPEDQEIFLTPRIEKWIREPELFNFEAKPTSEGK